MIVTAAWLSRPLSSRGINQGTVASARPACIAWRAASPRSCALTADDMAGMALGRPSLGRNVWCDNRLMTRQARVPAVTSRIRVLAKCATWRIGCACASSSTMQKVRPVNSQA